MKDAVFWDVTPCGSCKNRRFGGMLRLNYQGDKNRCTRNDASNRRTQRRNTTLVLRLIVTANVVTSSPILVPLRWSH
jgi:hypothetical protein